MHTPQPGIFAQGTRHHLHLELDLIPGTSMETVRAALAHLSLRTVTAGAANLVLGFGPELWTTLRGADAVAEDLGPFTEVVGFDGHRAPATQHDMWAWVHGSDRDATFDTGRAVTAALAGSIGRTQECVCFVYHDSRDLTGFIDGTANPAPVDAPSVACIPDGRPGAGGCHVLAQRWVHDLERFEALPVEDQERVIGRTKADSVELPRDVRPPDAHISLAEVRDELGEERPLHRRSVAYGTVGEQGLFFLAFSAERDRFDAILARMYGVGDRTIRDHLLDFSTPVSGAYYFAPCMEELQLVGFEA